MWTRENLPMQDQMKKHYPRAWIENHYHAICADWHGQKNMRTDFSVCCSVLCSQLIAFCVETHHILREGVRERDRGRGIGRERERTVVVVVLLMTSVQAAQ